MNITYQNKTWKVFGVRTAEEVSEEHPDKRIGKLMIKHNLELLLLQEVGFSTIDLKIARIHKPPQQSVAFRDKLENIIDPDTFLLHE